MSHIQQGLSFHDMISLKKCKNRHWCKAIATMDDKILHLYDLSIAIEQHCSNCQSWERCRSSNLRSMPWDGSDQHASTLFLSHSFRSRTGSTRSVQESTRRQTHWLELALTCNSAASVSTCTTGLGRPGAQMASQQWWSTLDHHPDSQGRAHPDGHTVRKAEVQDPYTDSSKSFIVRYVLIPHKMSDQNYIEMILILTGQVRATNKTCTTPCTRLRARWGPCKTIKCRHVSLPSAQWRHVLMHGPESIHLPGRCQRFLRSTGCQQQYRGWQPIRPL